MMQLPLIDRLGNDNAWPTLFSSASTANTFNCAASAGALYFFRFKEKLQASLAAKYSSGINPRTGKATNSYSGSSLRLASIDHMAENFPVLPKPVFSRAGFKDERRWPRFGSVSWTHKSTELVSNFMPMARLEFLAP